MNRSVDVHPLRRYVLAGLAFAVTLPLLAAPPSSVALVKDIQTLEREAGSSKPADFVQLGDQVYFSAVDSTSGRELWKTNGTDAGTQLVRDLIPGGDNTNLTLGASGSPRQLRVLGNQLFFRAALSASNQFFVSDGTEVGTQTLTMPNQDNGNSCGLRSIGVEYQGRLYLAGCNGGLFATDGTQMGTVLIKTGVLAEALEPQYYPASSQMFVASTNGNATASLLRTDGTTGGTRIINLGVGGGSFIQTSADKGAVLGNNLYFMVLANNASLDGLWTTDGTDAGTVRISTITSDGKLLKLGNRLYFMRTPYSAGGVTQFELWTSDGTAAGTVLVKNIGVSVNGHSSVFKGELYFGAGGQLWKTNGTAAGTVMLKSNAPFAGFVTPAFLTNLNDNVLVFRESSQLWKTDGTTAGTVKLADVTPGCDNVNTDASVTRGIVNVNGVAYFAGQTAISSGNGCELWKSDGSAAGTVQVKDILVNKHSDPQSFAALSGKALFAALSGFTDEVWKSDGTAVGTEKVSNANFSGVPSELVTIGSRVFYSDAGSLYLTDGTTAGTAVVTSRAGTPFQLKNLNGQLVFRGQDNQNGAEIWISDGTDAGTQVLKDIYTGPVSQFGPGRLVTSGTKLYFTQYINNADQHLFVTDGTASGTVALSNLGSTDDTSANFARITARPNGGAYFIRKSEVLNLTNTLWKTDGTPAGTVQVHPNLDDEEQFTVVGDTLYFVMRRGTDGARRFALWKSDGTEAGTVLVKDLNTGFPFGPEADPEKLTAAGGMIYFTAGVTAAGTGRELWKSDGTEIGTVMVKDICPGTCSSFIQNIHVLPDGDIVFAAAGGTGGLELWYSNGTEAGTVQIKDINPGPGSSTPENFFVAGDKLYFRADNGVNGRELWAATVPQGPTLVANDDEFVMLEDSGAFNFDPRINDLDSEAAPIIVTTVTQANRDVERFGTVTVQPGGIGITYTPLANFAGSYEFGYTISSGSRTATGRIKANVTNVNDPPTASDDTFNVPKNANARRLNVLGGDSTLPDAGETRTITAVTQPDKGGVTTTDGAYVYYTPVTSFLGQETFSYTMSDGSLTDSAQVTVNVVEVTETDTSPDDFMFLPRTGVNCSTEFTSDPITVTGVDDLTPISVSGGEYSVNGGAYRSASDLVEAGDTVTLRVMSSNLSSATSSVTVNIGDKSASYSVTTVAQGGGCNVGPPPDVSPDAFVFVDRVDVPVSTQVTSAQVRISGISQPAAISVTGGEYSINGGAFRSVASTVGNNALVSVRHTSAAANLTATDTTLTVGDKSDTFTSTTVPPGDRSPNLFIFNDLEGVPLSTEQTSNEVTISGLGSGVSVPLTVSGGSYSLDGGAFTTVAGTAVNGSRIRARHTSAAANNTAVNTQVTVGAVSDVFTTTTLRGTSPLPGGTLPDTTPSPFRFVDVSEVTRNTRIESNGVTITGMDAPTSISVNNGEYSIEGGVYTSATGSIANGQSVKVRQFSAALYGTATDTTLTVGGVSDVFTTVTQTNASSNSTMTADPFGRPIELVNSNGQVTELRTSMTPAQAPSRYLYPHGFYSFRVRDTGMGGRSTVVMTLPPDSRPAALVRCNARGCGDYPATIRDNTITYELQDGSDAMGDNDGMVNGEIEDPVAPAFLNPASTPAALISIFDSSGRPIAFGTSTGLLTNLRSTARPSVANGDFQYPNGFFALDITGLAAGGATVLTLHLPAGSQPSTFFECRPAYCDVAPNLRISGDTVSVTLVDGGLGDADGSTNGTIRFGGAPGRTDGGGGSMALSALLGLLFMALGRNSKSPRASRDPLLRRG